MFNRQIVLGLLVLIATARAEVAEMVVKVTGPKSVYRGNALNLRVTGQVLRGTDTDLITVYHNRLPQGVSSVWTRACCTDTQVYRVDYAQLLTLRTLNNAPLGRLNLTITYATPGGVTADAIYTIEILDAPAPVIPVNPPPSPTPLAAESLWKQQIRLGDPFCYQDTVAWEGGVWYYDGARVFYNLSDITGSRSFDPCAEFQAAAYRKYVLDNQGRLPGWRYFPHGLAMHYQKTGDLQSLRALRLMLFNGPFSKVSQYVVDPDLIREVSYAVGVHLQNERVGLPRQEDLQPLVEVLLGHFEQLFVSRQKRWQPFMVALGAEALISYWETTNDPRVLPMLKRAADSMWAESWSARNGGFAYTLEAGVTYEGAGDLNLLIAPVYGWVYAQTREVKYRDMGDEIFWEGVNRAWLGAGKQFSQNYRWSGKYPEWRRQGSEPLNSPPVPPPGPAPAQPPVLRSVTPASGSGRSQVFVVSVEEATGAQNLRLVSLTIDTTNKAAASCAISVAPQQRTISLMNDLGTSTISASLDTTGLLENGQCSITLPVTAVSSAALFTVQIPVSFRASFVGPKNLYVSAINAAQVSTGTLTPGTFTVTAAVATGQPVIDSVIRSSNSGLIHTFTINVDEPTGARNLEVISLSVDSSIKSNASCSLSINLPSSAVTLRDDTGMVLLYGALGSNRTLSNSQCTVAMSSVVASAQARRVTLQVTISFDPSYRGTKSIFVNAANVFRGETGVMAQGMFTIE
ncbi:MAG: hypothetical protein K2X03_26020 [Bryobacteraceae bacterium]|nr:hypothetical protein [Bryobacteraceae bacterium]